MSGHFVDKFFRKAMAGPPKARAGKPHDGARVSSGDPKGTLRPLRTSRESHDFRHFARAASSTLSMSDCWELISIF